VAAAEGDLMRMPFEFTATGFLTPSFSKVLSNTGTDTIGRPFTGPPLLSKDSTGNHWVYAGSGRYLVAEDSLSTGQQGYYGVKEPIDTNGNFTFTPVPLNGSSPFDLVNTTDIAVFDNGNVESVDGLGVPTGNAPTLENGDTVSTFTQLQNSIAGEQGWYFEFEELNARNVGRSGRSNVSVLFTEYEPSIDVCEPLGKTFLNVVNFSTGTATPNVGLELVGSGGERLKRADSGNLSADGSDGSGDGLSRDKPIKPEIKGPVAPQGRLSWREILIE